MASRPGGAGGHQRDDELVEAVELAVQELRAPSQLAQRDAGGVAGDVAAGGAAATPARLTRAAGVCLANRARRSSGPVRTSALAWLMVRVRSPAALRLATIRVRIASTAPSRPLGAPRARPDCAARAALTASSGSDLPCRRRSCRSERSTSTTRMPAAVMWRARPGAVTAGPFDADQAHGAEPAQPAQQAGVAGRGGGELPDAEQPADGIERGGDMGIGVGVHAAGDRGATGNGACFFYDGHCHPFLRLRDGTHPLAVGPVNPGLLHRTGRSDRHRRWVP